MPEIKSLIRNCVKFLSCPTQGTQGNIAQIVGPADWRVEISILDVACKEGREGKKGNYTPIVAVERPMLRQVKRRTKCQLRSCNQIILESYKECQRGLKGLPSRIKKVVTRLRGDLEIKAWVPHDAMLSQLHQQKATMLMELRRPVRARKFGQQEGDEVNGSRGQIPLELKPKLKENSCIVHCKP